MPSLIIRKRQDGTSEISGEAPSEHTFSARWIARELGNLAKVTITVQTGEGDVEYELQGFDLIDDDPEKPNFTGWIATRVGAQEEE